MQVLNDSYIFPGNSFKNSKKFNSIKKFSDLKQNLSPYQLFKKPNQTLHSIENGELKNQKIRSELFLVPSPLLPSLLSFEEPLIPLGLGTGSNPFFPEEDREEKPCLFPEGGKNPFSLDSQGNSENYKKKTENQKKLLDFKETVNTLSPSHLLNEEANDFFAGNSNSSSNSGRLIIGGGLIKKLLTELNLNTKISAVFPKTVSSMSPSSLRSVKNVIEKTELNKMDKQNRLLLYYLNKDIYKLKQIHTSLLRGPILREDGTEIKIKPIKRRIKELITQRNLLTRRTKLVRKLFISSKTGQCPSSMILSLLPVLPPDLRPIVKMGSGGGANTKIAASDLNRLYQRVIYRNERLKKFLRDPSIFNSTSNIILGNLNRESSTEIKFTQGLLQEAVDNLIQNNKSGVPAEKDARGRALKSLSDVLKGKQGRFRQYLLGKRVDYSGRSVIIVGPKLKIHQCGIPKEMALELFLPFLLKRILNYNLARTVVGAKSLINTNKPLVWELLTEIMRVCPVLLNRAPTLHRLGIQAFIPKLVDGRAILLHPLVCSAFNADFDGDQMAVHVPITVESRAEAWKLMLSRNNLLSPATGEPISVPSQDMVLGCYYLTTQASKGTIKKKKGFGLYFKSEEDVLKAYDQQKIDLHAVVWLQWTGLIEDTNEIEQPIEIRITKYGIWKEINPKSHINFNYRPKKNTLRTLKLSEESSNYKKTGFDSESDPKRKLGFLKLSHYIKTTPGKIIFNEIIKKCIKSTEDKTFLFKALIKKDL